MVSKICGLLTGIVIIILGVYFMLTKNIITNKDIIIMLILCCAYIGYILDIIYKKL